MKKIVFIIVVLFIAIVSMAYLYFSGLNFEQKTSQHSLYAAAANSSLIFSFENDQSVIDILNGQDLLQDIIGEEKLAQLRALNQVLTLPGPKKAFEHQSVYISLVPGLDKSIDFLYSTQINPEISADQLLKTLNKNSFEVESDSGLLRLTLNDSTKFYVGTKNNLLVFSTARNLVRQGLSTQVNQANKFAEFIKSNSRINKNSLAEVYINFETLPQLIKATMPGRLSGELAPLNNQQAYAALVYNFSKEKVLLTGVTASQNKRDYYQLFSNLNAQTTSIQNILPENTASFTAYAIENYPAFKLTLNQWFKDTKKDKGVSSTITTIKNNYRIDIDKTIPNYLKGQFITFQLNTSEKIGAIGLSNGDKLDQLLLELSTTYDEDIKQLKVDQVMYSLYGQAFENFKRPFYTIVDNYMVFSNTPGVLKSFLSDYRSNKLLINTENYSHTIAQLPGSSNIQFYLDLANSSRILQQNIYLPFYRHIYSAKGLKDYASVSFQLSGDKDKFLTNFLMVKKVKPVLPDSLPIVPQQGN